MLTTYKKKYRKLKTKCLSYFLSINESPIIVLGNQKSGTSVIAHLIADYGGLSKTIDPPEICSPTLEKLVVRDLSLLSFSQKYSYHFSKDLIKQPSLTFFYDQLLEIYPNAKYVFIIRDPRSNIRSILNRLTLPGNLEKLDASFNIDPLWQHIFDADLWGLPDGNYIETLAHRWVKAANVYKKNMELVRYEDFNTDKLYTIKYIATGLGVEQKNNIIDQLDVQYQPKGKRNVDWKDFFGIDNLQKIEEICSDYMGLFNYDTKYI